MTFRHQPASWRDAECLAAVLAAVTAALALAATYLPAGFVPRCGFKLFTGLPCPTCGAFRALQAWRAGDMGAAFRLQPLFCLAGFAACVWILYAVAGPVFRISRVRARLTRLDVWRLLVCGGAVVLADWAYLIAAGR